MVPLANAYVPREGTRPVETFYPLHAKVCGGCRLVQLDHAEPPHKLFGQYAYFSAYSSSWREHCARFAERMTSALGLGSDSRVVEVASNDGCLLTCFQQRGVPVHGIDPAANVAAVAQENGVPTEVAFFGAETAQHLRERGVTADLLIANNVLAHVPDINDFVAGMKQLLQRNGTISVEFPHLLKLIENSEFDTIYHEHVFYLSLETVRRIFSAHRLAVTDVEELPTHGGSLRVLAKHIENNPSVSPQVDRVIRQEAAAGLNRLETYQAFQQRVRQTKHSLLAFLLDAQRSGKRIAAYGAPAKGTTLLNSCGIDADFIEFTVDRNPQKQHHYIPGTRIPILHPDAINMHRPDYVLILPWNLRDEIMAQLADIRRWGGRFVVPIPETEVLP